jgi:16S rRNA G966 N2-methylase RsmD
MPNHQSPLPAALKADHHPPEYRLHRYWARKPHNVAAAFLRALVPPDGAVLDPFCGSGVILAEARALGLHATGIDLNPAAALIAGVTANPPDPTHFLPALDSWLDEARSHLAPHYNLPDGTPIRYCVHSGVIACRRCGATVRAWDIRDQGRKRRCPACGGVLRFNLSTLTGTAIVAVVTADGVRHTDPSILAQQQAAAYQHFGEFGDFGGYSPPLHSNRNKFGGVESPLSSEFDALLPNRRILVWQGMTAADLFTPRNLSAVRLLRDALPEAMPALHALYSAALAGMSRLIAYRNGLRGGGPAWSVPGFWVAPVHVEHHPLPLLESWARRYRKGIERLWDRLGDQPPATVITAPAQTALADLARSDRRYDLVFLDPPYGDSVPYLEFSALWNSLLDRSPDYAQEVVVSDRTAQPAGWEVYAARLDAIVGASVDLLKPAGRVLVTFNNLDGRAWEALLTALHRAGLRCESAHYVAPAVVSAKAQFAPDGSYHGDFWCVFQPGTRPDVPESQWAAIIAAALPADVTDPQRRRRLALRAILKANLPAEAVTRLDQIAD